MNSASNIESRHTKTTMDHVLKYTGVFGGVQGLTILMSIIRNKLTSKFLGAAGYGLMAQYMTIAESVNQATNFGIPFSSVRHVSELFENGSDDEIRHFVCVVRTWCVWTTLLGAFLCIAGAPLLGSLFFEGKQSGVWSIALLAPMIIALGMTAGEASILKGLRRLKRVALITALGAVSTLCLTVPLYWAFGIQGIIVALDISTLAVLAIHLAFTTPLYPWRVSIFSKQVFHDGWQMIRIGVPYILAAVAGAIMATSLQAVLKRYGSDEIVGFYRVGYTMMVTYAGLVFAAFESDFFPRLSSVNHDIALRNQTINQQIRVSVLLIAPLLIGMMVMMPIILRLLYNSNFLPATEMAICAVFYTYLRAITIPISYTALACGDSRIYLAMEVIYDAFSLFIIAVCYQHFGLIGAGIGLSLSSLFDMFLIGITYSLHYHFRMTLPTFSLALQQALLVGATLAVCLVSPPFLKYPVGACLLCLSAWRSYGILERETAIIPKLRKKLHL